MKIDIVVPQAGESVTEAMISDWFAEDGATVGKDDVLLELETDKANMELNAQEAGVLKILAQAGDVVQVGQVIGQLDTAGSAAAGVPAASETSAAAEPEAPAESPAKTPAPAGTDPTIPLSPAVRRIVTENQLNPAQIDGSGKDGRILKADAEAASQAPVKAPQAAPAAAAPAPAAPAPAAPAPAAFARGERVVPMSMMRRRIAQRLVEAQHTAAILTTFNEVDMSAVMALRSQYKAAFEKKHGVRLGFMSFFIKASIEALKAVPEINTKIDGNHLIYRDYCDIGVAVGTSKGLLVPILRDAQNMSFAQLEGAIANYAQKARENKIALDDLAGGTFTISNGGIYGSLLSTPILNPPQSGILGMHKIEKRPVVVDDQVVVRPMMYLALSYDHRVVDGKGAVSFLVKVKECIEDPARMMLEL